MENKEKIAVVTFKGDFLRTQADWKQEGKYPVYMLRNVYGMTRAEAVEKMADAFIKYEMNRDKSKPLNPYESIETALEALLDKE